MLTNIPVVKLGIIAVSRDCFPIELSQKRRKAIVEAYKGEIYECPVTVENEKDMLKAVEDVNKAGCNALAVFLGNFGPETPETLARNVFAPPDLLPLALLCRDGVCRFAAAGYNVGIGKLLTSVLRENT